MLDVGFKDSEGCEKICNNLTPRIQMNLDRVEGLIKKIVISKNNNIGAGIALL